MADKKILLVEDESIEAMDIKRTLESFGYEVPYVASSGEEAVVKVLEIMPDLILMDIILKGDTDAIDAVSKIKDLNIPVIYLIAHSEESTIESAKLIEPYGYIIKPYDPTELKYAIELALYKKQIEKELKLSESKYRSIFENSMDAVFLTAPNGDIVEANPAAERLFGYSNEQICKLGRQGLVDPNDKRLSELLKERELNGEATGELNFVKSNGSKFTGEISSAKFKDADGNERTSTVIRDISLQKTSQKTIKESEEKFRSLVENAADILIIHDSKGKIVDANKNASESLGYSHEELLQINIMDIEQDADLKHAQEKVWPKIKSDEPFSLLGHLSRKDGSIFPVEVRFAIVDIQGHKLFMGLARDITKPKLLENEKEELLKESQKIQNELSILIENIVDEVWFCDNQGDIILANAAARKFEQDAKPEDEKSLNGLIKSVEVFDSDGRPRPREGSPLLRSLNGEILTDLEEIVIFPGSDEKHYRQVSSAPIKNKNGEITGAVAVVRDITRLKKGEKEIIQAKEEWERTFDALPDLIAIIDKNYQIIRANKAMANKLGVHPDDVAGLTCYQAVHGINSPLNTCPHTKLLKNGCENSVEIHEDKLNGDYLVSVSPLHDQDGKLMGSVHVAHDITQSKKAEEKIKESENRYRMIGQLISDFAYSCVHGKSGIYEVDWITNSFYNITGFTEKELEQNRCWLFTVHPEDEQIAHKQLADLKVGSKNVRDFRIINSNGEVRWLKNHVECVEDKERGKLRIYGAAEDITQLKNATRELELSEEKYRTLFETDPDYTLLIGTDGIIRDVNKATSDITGLSREKLIGKHFIELGMALPEDIPTYVENITRLLKGEQIKPFESQFRDKDGKIRWGFVTLTPIIKDEKISSFLAIISDFTERKVAENQLKATLQEKELLLREIHHRVKNNMQILSSLLNLQIQHEDLDETIAVLKESQGRVKSMAMVHEKLYKSDNFSNINLREYLVNLVSDIFYSYGCKKETINLELDLEDIKMGIETAIPLGLIINELVTNSVKYAFPQSKGTISIKLKSLTEQMELTIADDGIGLPKDIDIENTKTLGLQLVNSLTDQIDGEIELDRSHGTEFKITFKELKYKKRT